MFFFINANQTLKTKNNKTFAFSVQGNSLFYVGT